MNHQALWNKFAGIFSLIAVVGFTVGTPTVASACGGGDMGCAVIDEVIALETDHGGIALQFRGAFAWTSGAGYGGITEDTKISKPILGHFEAHCSPDMKYYESCKENVLQLLEELKTGHPLTFFSFGAADAKPEFIQQDGDEPLEQYWPPSMWAEPHAVGMVTCQRATGLLLQDERDNRVVTNPSLGQGNVRDTDTLVIRPNVDLTDLAPKHVELVSGAIGFDWTKLPLDPSKIDFPTNDYAPGTTGHAALPLNDSAEVSPNHEAGMAGCSGAQGAAPGLLVALFMLFLLTVRRRAQTTN